MKREETDLMGALTVALDALTEIAAASAFTADNCPGPQRTQRVINSEVKIIAVNAAKVCACRHCQSHRQGEMRREYDLFTVAN